MEVEQKHVDAMRLLGEVDNLEFLKILANYFQAKEYFIQLTDEMLEKIKKEQN